MRRLTRPIRHWATALFIDVAIGAVRCLPASWVPPLGQLFGRCVGLLAWRSSKLQSEQIRKHISDPPPTGLLWADLGIRVFELLDAKRQLHRVHLTKSAELTYQQAVNTGRGIAIATIHLGHWELMAAALAQRGFSVLAVSARIKTSPLHRRLEQVRRQLGVRTVQPGGGARTLIRTLKDKGTISIFIDQNTNEQSRDLPFLGKAASTPITFERLVKTSNAVPLMIWNHRTPDGQYLIELAELDEADPLGSATRLAETLIKAYPSQWIWLHRRWSRAD